MLHVWHFFSNTTFWNTFFTLFPLPRPLPVSAKLPPHCWATRTALHQWLLGLQPRELQPGAPKHLHLRRLTGTAGSTENPTLHFHHTVPQVYATVPLSVLVSHTTVHLLHNPDTGHHLTHPFILTTHFYHSQGSENSSNSISTNPFNSSQPPLPPPTTTSSPSATASGS